MKAFHTCSSRGGIEKVKEKAPFLSQNDERTWLSQGYYFWTDNPYFAYKWGDDSYDKKYFIFEYFLNFTEDKSYLDLTSINGQLYFDTIKNKIKLKGEINYTVNGVINFLRDKQNKMDKLFPYVAIKAKDSACRSQLHFVKGRTEMMSILERQQICVFKESSDIISFQKTEHPN